MNVLQISCHGWPSGWLSTKRSTSATEEAVVGATEEMATEEVAAEEVEDAMEEDGVGKDGSAVPGPAAVAAFPPHPRGRL